jgi:hypothetical protein
VTDAQSLEVRATKFLGREIMHAKKYLKNTIKQET